MLHIILEIVDYMGFTVSGDEQCCWVTPLVLDFVVVKTIGDWIELSSES